MSFSSALLARFSSPVSIPKPPPERLHTLFHGSSFLLFSLISCEQKAEVPFKWLERFWSCLRTTASCSLSPLLSPPQRSLLPLPSSSFVKTPLWFLRLFFSFNVAWPGFCHKSPPHKRTNTSPGVSTPILFFFSFCYPPPPPGVALLSPFFDSPYLKSPTLLFSRTKPGAFLVPRFLPPPSNYLMLSFFFLIRPRKRRGPRRGFVAPCTGSINLFVGELVFFFLPPKTCAGFFSFWRLPPSSHSGSFLVFFSTRTRLAGGVFYFFCSFSSSQQGILDRLSFPGLLFVSLLSPPPARLFLSPFFGHLFFSLAPFFLFKNQEPLHTRRSFPYSALFLPTPQILFHTLFFFFHFRKPVVFP